MRLGKLLLVATFIFLSSALYSQSEIVIDSSASNVTNSCSKSAYKSVQGCNSLGWTGNLPLEATDWIIFDFGKTYQISGINLTLTVIRQPGPVTMSIEGSNDDINYFTIVGLQNISSGINTFNVNCSYRYVKFTNFEYLSNTQPGNAPTYIGRVSFIGNLPVQK